MGTSLIEKVVSVAPEMGFDNLTVEQLTAAIASGTVVIMPFDLGFAVVDVEGTYPDNPAAILRMLYVEPKYRGQGVGTVMLKVVVAKHAREHSMRLACIGKQLAAWFAKRGFKIVETRGKIRQMIEKPPPQKNRAKTESDKLYAICRRLDEYAQRNPNDELRQVAIDLHGFAIAQAFTTVGQARREQTAKAKQHRNNVTNEDVAAFVDDFHKKQGSTSNYGLLKAAAAHFGMSREGVANRLKAIPK